MCGVLAQITEHPARRPSERFARALRTMKARGPDGEGIWTCPTTGLATLGHRRLAIQDRSPAGHQPMLAQGGPVAITYNGEIYNAPAIRFELSRLGTVFTSRSDTEVLLAGYLAWGTQELLRRLRGMFAFVVWDARPVLRGQRPLLTAAVDHAAMKPLYWSSGHGSLTIASTADALRTCVDERIELDPAGMCHVLSLGYCPAPTTVWSGVSKLGPGTWFEWSPGMSSPAVRTWWSPPEMDDQDEKTDDPRGRQMPADSSEQTSTTRLQEFDRVIEEVVSDHLLSDVPVSVLLSAGLDSSLIASVLSRGGQRVPCVTIGLEGPDNESVDAAAVAAHLGMPHRTAALGTTNISDLMREVASVFDEPQGFGALLTMTAAARAARREGTVVLSGDGGDEAFGGYAWYGAAATAGSPDPHARELSRRVSRASASGSERAAALASLASVGYLHGHLQSVMPRFHPAEAAAILEPLRPQYDEASYVSWLLPYDRPRAPDLLRRQRLDLAGFCAGSVLPKLDRATMACGLELRAPFLDRRVLEWALNPRRAAAQKPSVSKPDVRAALNGRVPATVLQRPKQGFSLRVPMSDVIGAMIARVQDSRLVRDGVVREDWRAFVAPDAPNAQGRAFLICALAAWWEERA